MRIVEYNNIKRAFFPTALVLIFLGWLFFIAQSFSQTNESSAGVKPVTVTNETQTQIMGSGYIPKTGGLNNKTTSSCSSINYSGFATFAEITTNSYQNVSYQYIGYPWYAYGAGVPFTGHANNMLVQPATYNPQCQVNEPQVDWR